MLDCFSQCRLISENAIPNGLDDLMLSEDEVLSACDAALLKNESELRSFDSIVAYGLGHFSTCPIARLQFAMLLLLADFLKVNILQHCTINRMRCFNFYLNYTN